MRYFATCFNLLCLILSLSLVGAIPASASDPTNAPAEIINLLQIGLVDHINVLITLDSFVTNIVSANFTVKNPLLFELTIDRVTTEAGVNGTVFAQFDQSFERFIVPPLGSANSGTFGNVSLVQGATASLSIIPLGELDIIDANVFLRGLTIAGIGGIPVPLIGLQQKDVSTTYTLDLS